jgi:hypothetical protein
MRHLAAGSRPIVVSAAWAPEGSTVNPLTYG